ncbi:actin nucleation-promoting factor WASL-like isoform X2 [Molothrus ater]|uniref:actin nucleation-promoting factor WASL-like isoform X2 n=1 Tax=Molothrus ater TaxID=84834 RepID=UPI00174DCE6F|nr:actin nucleation-promoting factor WASL-like isoform X2 [Molothrus ater]
MAGSHWAGTERCQRRTSVTRRLHRHPPPHAPLPPPRTGRRQAPPPPARAGAAPPLHRPPLSAPLALDNVNWGKSVIPHPRSGLWRRLCDPQPQRPCDVLGSVRQSPQQSGLKTIRYISMRQLWHAPAPSPALLALHMRS